MMAQLCKVQVNGESFSAYRGDLLLDAALMNGIDIPHDCRSGYCGTCRVRVLGGRSFGGDTGDKETVHACQARIVSDLRVAVEDVPEIASVSGVVAELVAVAPDVCEVCIEASQLIEYIPGQYYSVRFRGFPARCFSPTAPLDWPCDEGMVRFHVHQVRNGRVSSALGRRIRVGHRVTLDGPFGSAYLRADHSRRLVLVASGTGFAPIWSIAEAAIKHNPRREMVLVVGARTLESLYMVPALCRLAHFPSITIIPVVSEIQSVTAAVRSGRPIDHLPALSAHDIVYSAGSPAMVEAIVAKARAAGATCYGDPFETVAAAPAGLWSLATEWLGVERRISVRSISRTPPSASRGDRIRSDHAPPQDRTMPNPRWRTSSTTDAASSR
jgi:NAD(P)H-flavin reductase/ferredoxin